MDFWEICTKKNPIFSFDIETSTLNDQCNIMYVWQMAAMDQETESEGVIMGRIWEEFLDTLRKIMELNRDENIYIFVHNLSYEFWYLSSIPEMEISTGIFLDTHKVIGFTAMNRIQFRCSYRLTGRSLKSACDAFDVKHKKSPEIEYDKIFLPTDELPPEWVEYCKNDVLSVCEIVKKLLDQEGDTLASMPYTSTGYVRRDVRRALSKQDQNKLRVIYPSTDVYKMLRKAFRGGDTHASRFYAGQILEGVESIDRSSSYPSVMLCYKYPMSEFVQIPQIKTVKDAYIYIRGGKALLMDIAIYRAKVHEYEPAPYLPRAKCYYDNATFDNGRILTADKIVTTITDVDLDIILSQYDMEYIEILKCYAATYDWLPQNYRDVIREYYRKKTELKGIPDAQIDYMLSKGKLNSIYGMAATDPVRESYELHADGLLHIQLPFDEADKLEEKQAKYNQSISDALGRLRNRRKAGVYQWGVWCTAYARKELYTMRKMLDQYDGGRSFVYQDTDSIKYLKSKVSPDFAEKLEAYNAKWRDWSIKAGVAPKDAKGKAHYVGQYELDAEYDEFVTWGAKKYADREGDTLSITVAGVPKGRGSEELEKHGGLAALLPGFTFTEIAKNRIDYIIDPAPQPYQRPTKCIVFHPVEYKLGITDEYEQLVLSSRLALKSLDIQSSVLSVMAGRDR